MSTQQSHNRVGSVTSLADFTRENPPEPAPSARFASGQTLYGRTPIVRLSNTRVGGPHTAALTLHTQAVNTVSEIVGLCKAHTINWLVSRGKPSGHPPLLRPVVVVVLRCYVA